MRRGQLTPEEKWFQLSFELSVADIVLLKTSSREADTSERQIRHNVMFSYHCTVNAAAYNKPAVVLLMNGLVPVTF